MATSQAGKSGQFAACVPAQTQSQPGYFPPPKFLHIIPSYYLPEHNTFCFLLTFGPLLTEKNSLEKDMAPTSESTKLEGKEGFVEYVGSGKLKGKSALITGGDSGIGRAVAALYAREGCNVSINYLPEEQVDADETKRLVTEAGAKCLCIPYDLEKLKSLNEIVEKHVKEYGGLDILVNNASKQVECEDFANINLDAMESTFKSNILQMMALTKFALPHIPKGGSIINTTSVVAFRGTAALVDYASTKGAIVAFTRSLAKQLVKKGIRVNAVA